MANSDQANSFLAMMQGVSTDTGSTYDGDNKLTEPGLPTNPSIYNGQELNLVTSKWEDRPLAGEKNTSIADEVITTKLEVEVSESSTSKPVFIKPYRIMEKSKQRHFGLTDSQHQEFLQAAADFGFVRLGKGGAIEPNASAFLQKIIDLKLWEKLDQIEGGASHE